MPIIDTSTLRQNDINSDTEFVYNCLDCAVTLEVFEEVSSLYNTPPDIYSFSRALQAPVLEMMCRGFRVDEYERRAAIVDIRELIARLNQQLQMMAGAVWDKELNPRSPKQLLDFFYGRMRLPEIWSSQKGVRKLSMNMETLEKLEVYLHARPIIAHILRIRELSKMLSVLETEIDSDGRMRTSYNIGGTESGRFSSSANAFGTGTNLQNLRQDPDWKIEDGRYKISLRKIFVADPGYKICGIDLEQAESREVGWQLGLLFDDWSYLDACEAGDLHTATCMLIWQDLPWTTDPKANRKIADQNFYRQFSYRDMSKRGGHGCLTAEHEVLTKNGWVPISSKPQEILAWSQHGKSFFTPVSNWIDKDWEGQLVSLRGAAISVDATDDHKLIYRTNEQNGWRNTSFGKIPKSYIVPLGDNYVGGNEDITPDVARLIAAFQADGTQASVGVMNFKFQKLRKKMRIEMLAINAGIAHKVTPTGAYVYASNWPKNAGAYLLNWPKEALEAYIDEQKYWDGHIAPDGKVHISSANKEHLDWLRTIGRLVGIGGYMDKPHISGHGSTIWRISQNNRKYAAGRQIEVTRQQMSCRVYCPTISTGAFYIRHNGKISITGNSNYLGTPFTMARHLKVPTKLMESFQNAYFRAYPIPRWHTWTAGQIQTIQQLTTPFGRRRHFFGRPNDDTTLREAVAYVPQSATADRMNLALWRMWYYMGKRVQLLAQVHDAVYFQFPEHLPPADIIAEALSLLSTPFLHTRPNGEVRKFDVPGEAKVGWNWGNYHEKHNPDGLQKWKGQDDRKRSGSGLQRVM